MGDSGKLNLSKNNVIIGNQSNSNVDYGIRVGGTGNIIVSNTANANGDDRFGNDRLGIYSPPTTSAGITMNVSCEISVAGKNLKGDLVLAI